MRDRRESFMQHLGFITRTLGIAPMSIILCYVCEKHYNSRLFVPHLFIILLMGYMGYVMKRLKVKLELKFNKHIVLGYLAVGTAYMISLIIIVYMIKWTPGDSVLARLVVGGIGAINYGLCMRDYDKHYSYLMSMELIAAISGIYMIASLIEDYTLLGFMYLWIITVAVYFSNQAKIEELLQRTEKNTPMIQSIRQKNTKWIWLIMGIILILYPLRKPIALMIGYVLKSLIVGLFVLIKMIINWLPVSAAEAVEQIGVSGMGMLEPGEDNKVVQVILWMVATVMVSGLLYFYRKDIMICIKEGWEHLKEILYKCLEFLFKREHQRGESQGAYEDVVEQIRDRNQFIEGESKPVYKRKWQKEVKKYLKLEEMDCDYRRGYRLIIEGLKLRGIDIKQSLTPREVMALSEKQLETLKLNEEIKVYEDVRYDQGQPLARDIKQLKKALKELLKINT